MPRMINVRTLIFWLGILLTLAYLVIGRQGVLAPLLLVGLVSSVLMARRSLPAEVLLVLALVALPIGITWSLRLQLHLYHTLVSALVVTILARIRYA
jgi:hypothetical protein